MVVSVGLGNFVSSERVTSIVAAASPTVFTVPEGKKVDATEGRLPRSAIFLDDGTVIISALRPEKIAEKLNGTGDKLEPEED